MTRAVDTSIPGLTVVMDRPGRFHVRHGASGTTLVWPTTAAKVTKREIVRRVDASALNSFDWSGFEPWRRPTAAFEAMIASAKRTIFEAAP